MTEMVQLQEGETLVGENDDLTSEQIAAKISEEQTPEVTEEEPIPVEEEVTVEEPKEEIKDEILAGPSIEEEYRKERAHKEFLLDLLKQKKAEPKPKEPTNEELLESLAADPKGFIRSQIQPYEVKLRQVEELRALDTARLYNADFRRLEPTVTKLREVHPNLADGKSAIEKWEVYYLLAKGMEVQRNEINSKKKEDTVKAKRLQEKKTASGIPRSTKATAPKSSKSVENMTSDEIAAEIKRLERGG